MLLKLCKGEQRRVNFICRNPFSIKVSWGKLNPWTGISSQSLSSFILYIFVGLLLGIRPQPT